MTGALRSMTERHDAVVDVLRAIPIEELRDMVREPEELDRRIASGSQTTRSEISS